MARSRMTHVQTVLSADFLDENGALVFPDISLETIAGSPRIRYRFLDGYLPEYAPQQLGDADVLLSLKPKVTARSLEGVERLCAIGRFGVGYDNVDLAACTEQRYRRLHYAPGGDSAGGFFDRAVGARRFPQSGVERPTDPPRRVGRQYAGPGAGTAGTGARDRRAGQYREGSIETLASFRARPAARARSSRNPGNRARRWGHAGFARGVVRTIRLCVDQLSTHGGDAGNDWRIAPAAHEKGCRARQYRTRSHRGRGRSGARSFRGSDQVRRPGCVRPGTACGGIATPWLRQYDSDVALDLLDL